MCLQTHQPLTPRELEEITAEDSQRWHRLRMAEKVLQDLKIIDTPPEDITTATFHLEETDQAELAFFRQLEDEVSGSGCRR